MKRRRFPSRESLRLLISRLSDSFAKGKLILIAVAMNERRPKRDAGQIQNLNGIRASDAGIMTMALKTILV